MSGLSRQGHAPAAGWTPLLLAGVIVLAAPHTQAGETIGQIKTRGVVRCGVSEGIAGFSIRDEAGRWVGLDADFCRAVAAAVLGDAERVAFVPLSASARFPALQSGAIDLLARNTTWTLGREADLGAQFAGILFYDWQALMVPAASGTAQATALDGAPICVEKGTTHAAYLSDFFGARGWTYRPVVLDAAPDAAAALFAGRCRAYTSDASQLAAARVQAPGGREAFTILPERISKQPLGPAVRRGDEEWFTLVRWVLFALIAAEEHGITRENVRALLAEARHPALQRSLATMQALGKALGTRPDWAERAVGSVGNYGEMFERNLGRDSVLQLDRGLNRLWTEGGLMYAPPLR